MSEKHAYIFPTITIIKGKVNHIQEILQLFHQNHRSNYQLNKVRYDIQESYFNLMIMPYLLFF